MMMKYDAIVAGAGVWGCTLARRLAEAGRRVLVLEKRPGVGGNCRCEFDPETGIEVHTYGSHIFHTNNEEVWKFVNRFARFNDYRHMVLAKTKKIGTGNRRGCADDGFHVYHLPIGKTLLEEFFGVEMSNRNLKELLSSAYGDEIFDAFIRGYTSKQWGVAPDKVDPSIIARLKVRDSYSTDYFDDRHQGVPIDGYNAMFEKMLDHPNIVLRTSSSLMSKFTSGGFEFFAFDEKIDSQLRLYYSGPIDALFNYKFGALPWRTLRFERETLPVADFQGNAVVNYTDAEVPYTRIHEFKHYHSKELATDKTVIMREYSAAWQPGDEPYYPIATPESAALLKKYQAEIRPPLVLGGRLGQYKYYDMDQAFAAALAVEI